MIEVAIAVVKQYWKIIAVGFIALVVFGFGYYKGYSHEKIKYDAHVAEDARLFAIAKAENDIKVRMAESITQNVTKEYKDEIDRINTYYKSHPNVVRLCKSNTTNTVPSTSQSSAGVSTTTNGVAEVTTEIDLQKASQEVAQCQALIKFEQEQDGIQ
jgi:hypothetical protein